jgi:hypothetical protein
MHPVCSSRAIVLCCRPPLVSLWTLSGIQSYL